MRHPPFYSGAAAGDDFTTHAGAERLAAMIRKAWAAVGVSLELRVVPTGRKTNEPGSSFEVKFPPDFVNGLPPRSAMTSALATLRRFRT